MERSRRLVQTPSGWKCLTCGFHSPLNQEMAEDVHRRYSPLCLPGSSMESDEPTFPLRQQHPSLMQPFGGKEGHQGASYAGDFVPARRMVAHWSNDTRMEPTVTESLRRGAQRHLGPFFEPPGGSSYDERAAGVNSGQMESDDSGHPRDIPTVRQRREAPDQQLTMFHSRIQQATRGSSDEEGAAGFSSEQLESDDAGYPRDIPRVGQRRDQQLMRPPSQRIQQVTAIAQGNSSDEEAATGCKFRSLEFDEAVCSRGIPEDGQRQEAPDQQPTMLYSRTQQVTGNSSDEEAAASFSSGQLESDDAGYHRDIPVVEQRRVAPDQQQNRLTSRIQQVTGVIRELRCAICFKGWRRIATPWCRHLVCCAACFPPTSPTCVLCRGDVVMRFPVEFHSSILLEDLDIPFLLTMTTSEDAVQVLVQRFQNMGFLESRIRRAIHLIQLESGNEALPNDNDLLDFLDINPSAIPSVEAMEVLLASPNVDETVKSRLCDYLESINKCLGCHCKPPQVCLVPCNHLALCRECFKKYPREKGCPDCGSPIKNHVAVFLG